MKLLKYYNGASYFYLTVDWQKKLFMATQDHSKEAILFLGSSRSAYAIDPSAAPEQKLLNLSLVAASFNENDLFSHLLVKNKIKAQKIYFELNPMSATKRHMKSMDNLENKNIFSNFSNTPDWIKSFLYKSPLFLERFLLKDILSSLVKNDNSNDPYRAEKRKNHIREFEEILDESFNGHLTGIPLAEAFKDRARNECQTMLNWTTSDLKDDHQIGLQKFKSILSHLKNISPEVIVWIPPMPLEYELNPQERTLIELLSLEAKKENIKMVDLSELSRSIPLSFFDCIHLEQASSHVVTKTLLKN